MRSYPSKTVNDAPNDEVLKGEKSERSETVRHTRVREDEKSKHKDFKDLIDEPCEKTYLMESSLNPSMHPTSGIEKGSSDGTVTIQPARDNNCNSSDMKLGPGPGAVSIVSTPTQKKELNDQKKRKKVKTLIKRK